MKRFFLLLILLFLINACSLDVEQNSDQTKVDDNTYQFSSKDNLLKNEYFKEYSLYDLDKKGNFGLGTLNGVDGELVILDGKYYQVKFSGKVLQPLKSSLSPFANIKSFNEDESFEIKKFTLEETFNTLKFKNPNDQLVAIKLSGNFEFIKARSVQKVETTNKSLSDIIKDQAIFNFDKVSGTMVGFYTPTKYDKECFTGFHFHFISDNFQLGGHVLDFKIDSVKTYIDFSDSLKLIN